mmetsp:Transcript_39858/g.114835  ORF Transcript_39858/g.114835 Transcript_39858/m.114835 type:complete len:381 (-) Transcript_39858:90-1232(-)
MCRTHSALLLAALCGACAGLRSKDNSDTVLRAVVSGQFSDVLVQGFASTQKRLMTDLYQTWPKKTKSQSILVVSQVANSPTAVRNFEFNMEKLNSRNTAGDQFSFALFHSQPNASLWHSRPWYRDAVVYESTGPLCKAEAWIKLDPALVKSYDFVWLLDSDFRMDFFSWDMYRTVLSTIRPMVSQPAIVPSNTGFALKDPVYLRMQGKDTHDFMPLAREVAQTSAEASLISTKLWDAVRIKLQGMDNLKTAWCVPDVWNVAAGLVQKHCRLTGPVVIDASPLRRMNSVPELLAVDEAFFMGRQNECMGEMPCPDFPVKEVQNFRETLKPFCELPHPLPTMRKHGPPGMKPSVHAIAGSRMWASKFENIVEERPVMQVEEM